MTKEHDVEAGGAGTNFRIPLLRRKRVLAILCLAIPMIVLGLMYGYQTEAAAAPFSLSSLASPKTSAAVSTTIAATRTATVPAINDLAGALPGAVTDSKQESVLLLLRALKDPAYRVGTDWREVYVTRTPLTSGIMGTINSAATNKFTDLLFRIGLPPSPTAGTGVKNDALQLYRLSRTEWAAALRTDAALTVFSKSYCPYSKRAKKLLTSLHANMTVYEVDLRPDAHELQSLLAAITTHTTFPTILAQDHLIGGADDLDSLYRQHTLEPLLTSIGALPSPSPL